MASLTGYGIHLKYHVRHTGYNTVEEHYTAVEKIRLHECDQWDLVVAISRKEIFQIFAAYPH